MASVTPTIGSLTTLLTNSLLLLLVEDLAIEEHRLACRRRAETYSIASTSTNGFLSASAGSSSAKAGPSPSKKEQDSALYDCMNCDRTVSLARIYISFKQLGLTSLNLLQIAAPRYASHLSSCMGLGGAGGTRRGESRRQAALASGNGTPKGPNGLAKQVERANSVGSYASDEDAMSGVDKTIPPPPGLPQAAPAPAPHLTSHPLSKTLSLPTPAHSNLPRLPPPPPVTNAGVSIPMQSRASLPTAKKAPKPQPNQHTNDHDRPDSDSSADEDSADEKRSGGLNGRGGQGPVKMPKKSLPVQRRIESDSASESGGSDGSASD
ncbi:hypothetical protein P7C70_g8004, partial [Phenoliferia sp. Uapishka_3]